MTESGCQICGNNTFSGDGASVCTDCPDGKVSEAGSTSEDDCYYGNLFICYRKNSLIFNIITIFSIIFFQSDQWV